MLLTDADCLSNTTDERIDFSFTELSQENLMNVVVPFLTKHPEIDNVLLACCFLDEDITFDALKALLEVESITSLDLSGNIISHKAAEALKYAKVFNLNISGCHFTDEMLNNLNHNKDIRSLNLCANQDDIKLSDMGLITLTTLPNLIDLEICSSAPGEKGCEYLAKMKLEILCLDDCQINSAMMSKLRNNNTLVELSINHNPLGDEGMAVIPTMKKLKKLAACSTKLTDLATVYLASSPSLRDIKICGSDEHWLNSKKNQLNSDIALSNTNQFTDDGQRILALNPKYKARLVQFPLHAQDGYFKKQKDMETSPIKKLNFAKNKGETPPFPSLRDISLFKLKIGYQNGNEPATDQQLGHQSDTVQAENTPADKRILGF